jgi:hypothetical protein
MGRDLRPWYDASRDMERHEREAVLCQTCSSTAGQGHGDGYERYWRLFRKDEQWRRVSSAKLAAIRSTLNMIYVLKHFRLLHVVAFLSHDWTCFASFV